MNDVQRIARSIQPNDWSQQADAERAAGPYPCKGFEGECGAPVEWIHSLCSDCEKRKYTAERAREFAKMREGQRKYIFSSVPADLQWAAEDSPDLVGRVTGGSKMVRKILQAADALLAGKVPRVAYQAPAGVGKTVGAVVTFRKMVWEADWSTVCDSQCGRNTRWSRFADAAQLGWIRMNSPLGDEPEELTKIIEAPVLVLDDIGGEAPIGQQAIAIVGEVIRARHRSGLPTIYTTGFSVEELTRFYGSGVTRRIFDRAALVSWPSEVAK